MPTEIEGIDTVTDYERQKELVHKTSEYEQQLQEEEASFYSNSTNQHGDDNIWGLLSGVGGNIYEW